MCANVDLQYCTVWVVFNERSVIGHVGKTENYE